MSGVAPIAPQAKPPGVFSNRAVAWMLGVGVIAFAGLAALSAYAPELRDGLDGGGHALSRSAIGYAGIVQLLGDTGATVVIARGAVPSPEGRPGLVILTPPPGMAAKALEKVDAGPHRAAPSARARQILIVLPKWIAARDPAHPGWVEKAGAIEPAAAVSAVRERIAAADAETPLARAEGVTRPILVGSRLFPTGRPLPLGPVDLFQTDLPDRAQTLLSDEAGLPVLYRLDDRILILTEPDLLNNQGLHSQATALAALTILDRLRAGGPVIFDVTLNGFERSRSLLRLSLGPPFLGATLCAVAAALLMGAHAALRFGPTLRAKRAFDLGKRSLVDNTAVLIERASREPRMGGRYALLTRRIALHGIAGEREPPADEASLTLDRLTPEGEPPFSRLVARADSAKTGAELVAAARALHERRLEMTRERL